jgi:hypothetical protein
MLTTLEIAELYAITSGRILAEAIVRCADGLDQREGWLERFECNLHTACTKAT